MAVYNYILVLASSSPLTDAADNKEWLINCKLQNLRMRFLLYI